MTVWTTKKFAGRLRRSCFVRVRKWLGANHELACDRDARAGEIVRQHLRGSWIKSCGATKLHHRVSRPQWCGEEHNDQDAVGNDRSVERRWRGAGKEYRRS